MNIRVTNYGKLITLFILCLNAGIMNGQDIIQQIVYKPICVFHSPYSPETGAPRQGILIPEGKVTIVYLPW